MLAISLLLSLLGLLCLLPRALDPDWFRGRVGYETFVLAAFVVACFFTGVVSFIGFARGPASGPCLASGPLFTF